MKELGRAAINDWIVHAGLSGVSEVDLLAGVCERLCQAGTALWRGSIANDLLDPTYDGRGMRWVRDRGGVEEVFARTEDGFVNEDWLHSPFRLLMESGAPVLRRRLDESHSRGELPLLDQFQDQGATDYVAHWTRVGEGVVVGEGEGIVSSWTIDSPGGFEDAQLDLIAAVVPTLALALMLRTSSRAARTLIRTYLGSDAADRVLRGNIVRGRAERIRAVVWYSDLVGFTRISDATGSEVVLALLNDYAEAQVEAIEAHGGHVLKFMGDGILAIFPDADTTNACARALDAVAEQRRRVSEVNAQRVASELPVTQTHVALHVGELLYGNLGSRRRLDFTVLGSAVNEAARIEALCASLEQAVVVSGAFADAAGDARNRLVSLGRYALKGVARPQEMFTLDPEQDLARAG
jgi:adenylate cyclase